MVIIFFNIFLVKFFSSPRSIKLNLEILKIIKNEKLLKAKIERLKKENFLDEDELNLILKK